MHASKVLVADGTRFSKCVEHINPLFGNVEFEEAVFSAVEVLLCLLPHGNHEVILLPGIHTGQLIGERLATDL